MVQLIFSQSQFHHVSILTASNAICASHFMCSIIKGSKFYQTLILDILVSIISVHSVHSNYNSFDINTIQAISKNPRLLIVLLLT
jgi:hypothetical protein